MKTKKLVSNNAYFRSAAMVTTKIITKIIENHSEFS